MLQGILAYAHSLLKETVKDGDLVIDATCGNGNDTLLLARLTGSNGKVLAFDVQAQAIEATENLMKENHFSHVQTIHKGHEFVTDYLDEDEEIAAAIFNLGYLPRSDKKVITKSDSTLNALYKMIAKLKKNGIIVLVIYHGHPGGKEEKHAVLDYTTRLDQKKFSVLRYGFINQKNNPPFIIAIEKR